MLCYDWRRWFSPQTRLVKRNCRTGRYRGRPYRPQIEFLEGRLAPATHTWTGALSNLWSSPGNWIGGSPTGDNIADLIFPGSAANLSNTNDLNGLIIQSISFVGINYVISGNGMTLSAGITVDTNVGGIDTLNSNITLGAAQSWTINSPAGLAVGGVVSGTAAAGLTIFGALALSGDNIYAGPTTLTTGSLRVGSNTALGIGQLNFLGGAISSTSTVKLANPFSLGTSAPVLVDVGGDLTFSGPGTLGNQLVIANTNTTTFSNALSGPGSVYKATGAGTLVLSGNNTYTGGTTLIAGTLIVGNNGALGTGLIALNGGTITSACNMLT